ncbi:MAG TPA: formyltransferase family protein [Streptosporangiaceae bacterium]|jgi:methionyl-tRNA formyltransferase|nr:formyltransferase family protein [Streptosporangiaceae bacterium]
MAENLRIVAMNAVLYGYQLIADWAERRGHHITLVVTPPASRLKRYGDAPHLPLVLPESQDVLVSAKLDTVAPRAIAALEPDLVISSAFPRRIPTEITAIPRYGAVNLHPAPLPRGRGLNPLRHIYEGDEVVGATLHRIEPEFDAGAILSQRIRPLPADVSGQVIYEMWTQMLAEVLDEGTERAIKGDYGTPQDEAQATYPAQFTPEERLLDWDEPARTVQCRAAALNVRTPIARARIGDEEVLVYDVRCLTSSAPAGAPGTIVERFDDGVVVRVRDGAVRVTTRRTAT